MAREPGHYGPRRKAPKPDLLETILQLGKQLRAESEPSNRDTAAKALSEFLMGLDQAELRAISHRWLLVPKADQAELFEAFFYLDGSDGPPAKLMQAIHEARIEFLNALPAETDPLAIEMEEQIKALARADGQSPEAVDDVVALSRRQGKWVAADDAVLAAERKAKLLEQNDKLRRLLPQAAKLADRLSRKVATLHTRPGRAAGIRDGLMMELLNTTGEIGIAAGNHSFYDSACRAFEMLDAIAGGRTRDPEWIDATAACLRSDAQMCRQVLAYSRRDDNRPRKAAVDGALAAHSDGRDWPQVAVILNEKDLRLEPHTSENIRKTCLARRKADRKL